MWKSRFGCKPNLPTLGPNRVEEVFEGFKVCVEKPVRLQTEPTRPGTEDLKTEPTRSGTEDKIFFSFS